MVDRTIEGKRLRDVMAEHVSTDERTDQSGAAVLVSGASFAGLATAYWLNELGYRVTVIETARELRRGGTPVDVEGQTIDVLTRMGVIDAVRAKALPPRSLEFKNDDDTTLAVMSAQQGADEPRNEQYEIHRDDLLDILFAAIHDVVDIRFGLSITHLENRPDAVTVTFSDDRRDTYALVFGCDGNRSNTRRLAFDGTAQNVVYPLGGYFFIKVAPTTALLPANVSQIYSVAGRTALLNGYDDQTDVALAFRTTAEIDYDYRDRAAQRRMIHESFDGLGWKVPAMLDILDADDDFYFDMLNQVRMPTWSTGRVALVGDAGYCVSPVAGMGGSMAIIGAGTMADALRRNAGDHVAAFDEYERTLRPLVDDVQERAATLGMSMMFPSDDDELAERNRTLSEGTLNL
ncbi:FAD-dependent oxidoreductase [Mycolicibacterium madagascariense]|uniref:FAD-dependent oxidoreductase n=1 Tax=Mycolicibacterium madagascariense TaxID=212765 RepID=A0A7I7XK46_9MYCO|nr:FAD-dependent monooxygenase [Mycolicibacterium madagascariense]MCV7011204.1 FAD-dependent monooxygenase [Mycolicibacterium madagascariense]BBZ29557.1 FAD-dependent oxidoreductase [Mycolicibacterium madagascariense]